MTTLINGLDSLSTIRMFEAPVTDLARFIGESWYLSVETLAERAGVGVSTIRRVFRGVRIGARVEKKIRDAVQVQKELIKSERYYEL